MALFLFTRVITHRGKTDDLRVADVTSVNFPPSQYQVVFSVHQDPAAVVACMVLLEETHFYCAFLPIFMKMGAGVTGLQPKAIILFVKV